MKNIKILIVDDIEKSRKLLDRILKKFTKFEIIQAESGAKAIEIIKREVPDIILLDIIMPDISGYDVANQIKLLPRYKDIPIIFLTGQSDMESRIKAFENGGVDFICKPYHKVELLKRIEVHLKLKLIQDELKAKNKLLAEKEVHLKHLVDERTKELITQLHTNSLTGLPSRIKLLEDIHASDYPTVILINIDSFKEINNFYGHVIGDNVIIELNNRLRNIVKEKDMNLYKLHADEFAVLIQKEISEKKLNSIIIEIHDAGELQPYVIKGKRIITYFQPIFNNVSKSVEKYETLVRLVDESGQIILPDYFLRIAKKTKQYIHITKAVIQGAFDVFRNRELEFAINLSVEDMLNAETVKYIKNNLLEYELGERVVFEILESEGIERYDQVYDFICQVKDLGCKIAIDDFGSGYSNFDHILRLDVDYIKIDSSLIENIDKNKDSQIIVETIVDFCKKLNINTIAEKVHSRAVFDKVVDLGVCYSQGYFLGKPEAI